MTCPALNASTPMVLAIQPTIFPQPTMAAIRSSLILFCFPQDRDPREARLEAFEADLLEQAPVVGDREIPIRGRDRRRRAGRRRTRGSGAARRSAWHPAIKPRRYADARPPPPPCCCRSPAAAAVAAAELPIFDAHVHYSHDAWENLPPKDAIAILRKAGLEARAGLELGRRRHAAPRRRGAGARDPVAAPVSHARRGRAPGCATRPWRRSSRSACASSRYAAIGEFHLYGADADLPVPRRMVALAKQHKLVLHAHSDVDAIERLFKQDPEARILWAHSGFDRARARARDAAQAQEPVVRPRVPQRARRGGKVPAEWRALFTEFPDRFMVGTDTFTPERWHYIVEHANWSRAWLADLPPPLAERIAWRNGEALFAFWKPRRAAIRRAPRGGSRPPAASSQPARRRAACGADLAAPRVRRKRALHRRLPYAAAPDRRRRALRRRLRGVPARRRARARSAVRVDANMPEHRHGMNYRPASWPAAAGPLSRRRPAVPHARTLGVDVRRRDGSRNRAPRRARCTSNERARATAARAARACRWRRPAACRAMRIRTAPPLDRSRRATSCDASSRSGRGRRRGGRSVQSRVRQRRRDRLRRSACSATRACRATGTRRVRDLPPAGARVHRRPAARGRASRAAIATRRASSTSAASAGTAGTARTTTCGRRACGRCSIRAKWAATSRTSPHACASDAALRVRLRKAFGTRARRERRSRRGRRRQGARRLPGDARDRAHAVRRLPRRARARRPRRPRRAIPLLAQRGLAIFVGNGNCNDLPQRARASPTASSTTSASRSSSSPAASIPAATTASASCRASRYNLLGPYNDDATRSTATSTRHVALEHRNFGEFKVPSLRNVARTAPYMHNGSLATLRDVVRHYSEPRRGSPARRRRAHPRSRSDSTSTTSTRWLRSWRRSNGSTWSARAAQPGASPGL